MIIKTLQQIKNRIKDIQDQLSCIDSSKGRKLNHLVTRLNELRWVTSKNAWQEHHKVPEDLKYKFREKHGSFFNKIPEAKYKKPTIEKP